MKFLCAVITFLTLSCSIVFSQEIKGWRFKAGTNIATQKWEYQFAEIVDINSKSGQFYEVGREIKVKPYLSVISGLAYQEMGFGSTTKPEVMGSGVYAHFTNHFRYLTLQAALKLQMPKGKYKPYLMAGYQGGVLLFSEVDFWSSFDTFSARVRHYDDGPVLTLGFEMNTGKDVIPFIEFSHYRSVRNIFNNRDFEIWDYNNGVRLKPVEVFNRVYSMGGGIKF
jgi:hypothetical protein